MCPSNMKDFTLFHDTEQPVPAVRVRGGLFVRAGSGDSYSSPSRFNIAPSTPLVTNAR